MRKKRQRNNSHKRFQAKLSRTIAKEISQRKSLRRALVTSLAKEGTNLLLISIFTILIIITWYQFVAKIYLGATQTFGGVLFKDITIAKFISTYLPFPPTGWFSFWNQGSPIIGSYPIIWYYLTLPLSLLWGNPTGIQIAAMLNLLFYFIFSFFLFTRISKNPLLSWMFTLLLIVTPATYFTTVVKGDLVSAAVMPLLPLSMFLSYNLKNHERMRLIIFCLICAFSLLIHPIAGLILVILPTIFMAVFSQKGRRNTQLSKNDAPPAPIAKLKLLLALLAICLTVASPAILPLIISNGKLTTTSPCSHNLCWGMYPQDLRWVTGIILIPLILFFITQLLPTYKSSTVQQPQINWKSYFMGLVALLSYIVLVKWKFLNTFASELAPLETFWAIAFMVLTISASLYEKTRVINPRRATISLSLFFIITIIATPIFSSALKFRLDRVTPGSATLPAYIEQYILEKYQDPEHPSEDIIPNWVSTNETNWRLDSIRPDFYTWWNSYGKTPSTRGYAFLPSKKQLNWQFYLQESLIAPQTTPTTPPELLKNQGLFMLDAYAVRYVQNALETPLQSWALYNPSELGIERVAPKVDQKGSWNFSEINPNLISPIITPTNGSRVLIMTTDLGYDTLIRAFSLANLNGKLLVPIKGPSSIDALTKQDLTDINSVILYQHQGQNWEMLEEFLTNGGKIYVDIGALERSNSTMPQILGVKQLELYDREKDWQLIQLDSSLLEGITTRDFAPLKYGNDPWKLVAPPKQSDLEDWLKPVLLHNNRPIMSIGNLEKGTLIFSGMNLPYHITSYANIEEVELLTNIISEITVKPNPVGDFSFDRPKPNKFSLSFTNASGIWIKENFNTGWKATVNGRNVPVRHAGLDMMYIPIPKELQNSAFVEMVYQGNLQTWGLPFLSLLSIALAIGIGLHTPPTEKFQILLKKYITGPINKWWAAEDIE